MYINQREAPFTLRLELELPSQRVLHHLQTYNQDIEDQVEKGIKQAVEELSTSDTLANMVKEQVKSGIIKAITSQYFSEYKASAELKKILDDKTTSVFNEFADGVFGDKLRKALESIK